MGAHARRIVDRGVRRRTDGAVATTRMTGGGRAVREPGVLPRRGHPGRRGAGVKLSPHPNDPPDGPIRGGTGSRRASRTSTASSRSMTRPRTASRSVRKSSRRWTRTPRGRSSTSVIGSRTSSFVTSGGGDHVCQDLAGRGADGQRCGDPRLRRDRFRWRDPPGPRSDYGR